MGLEERAQERLIDGTEYRVSPLPFSVGQKALLKILKAMAPLLSAAVGGNTASMLAALPSALSEEDITWLAAEFGKCSQYKLGEAWPLLVSQAQEKHFAGRYETYFAWLIFCIEVNFAGFFYGIKNAGAEGGFLSRAMGKP